MTSPNELSGRDGAPRTMSGAERAVACILSLSKRELTDRLSARERTGLERLERALAAGKRVRSPRRARPVWVLGLVAAGVSAGFLVANLVHRHPALTFRLAHGNVSEGGYIQAEGAANTEVLFSDGSKVDLEPGTRTRVAELGPHGGRVLLEGGTAHVQVVPRAEARWAVEAGPYAIRVTGTEFDVAWSALEEELQVRLRKGSVIVTGPLASQGLGMEAGQHLVVRVRDGRIALAGPEENAAAKASEVADPAALESSPAAPERAETSGTPGAATAKTSNSRGRAASARTPDLTDPLPWSGRLRRGEFQSIVEEAEQRGMERVLSEGSRSDLAALADAARYARRADLARRTLLAERQRFSSSPPGREAAFFLGGLAEAENGAAALDWYATYLRENPEGAYASQAMGRKMVLLHKRGEAEAASVAAREYLERFPRGPYAGSAKKLLPPP